ncbi:MAG: threonine-phosphate decarboxylase CobD [Notoacmeibacter sp.]
MREFKPVAHGGALDTAIKQYGGDKAGWLDLSTGINPVAALRPKIPAHVWQALPDADLIENCLAAARQFYNIPHTAGFVAAPGVQALIQLLPQLRQGEKAAILGPTYGEYAHVFQTLGDGCRIINSTNELRDETVLVIVNPNNPDGRFFNPDVVLQLAKRQSEKNGLLIVDEAFCDMMPEISIAGKAGMPGLLVLKSFGKFFGLAGVRLGFAAGHRDDIEILQRLLGPWAVSGPALVAGAACYGDGKFKGKISRAILRNSNAQRTVFSKADLEIVTDVGLFHLIKHQNAKALHQGLARKHILTRVFENQPDWIRFGLTKNTVERARLAAALDACLSAI